MFAKHAVRSRPVPVLLSRNGKGKGHSVPINVNWGQPGDELLDVPMDSLDPSYDSSEELFERAFTTHKKSATTLEVDWADLVKEAQSTITDHKCEDHSPVLRSRSDSDGNWSENDTFFFEVL
jgi:hypothetical protein